MACERIVLFPKFVYQDSALKDSKKASSKAENELKSKDAHFY
jgi:hypothetical protein